MIRSDQIERRKKSGTPDDRRYSLPQIRIALDKALTRPEILTYMKQQLKNNTIMELMLNEPNRGTDTK